MSFLENKIPPPLVLLVILLMMKLVAFYTVSAVFTIPLSKIVSAGLVALGVGVAVSGVLRFRAQQTTVNPLSPEKATELVSSGIFTVTRNPMYLGMLCVALAWLVYLQNYWVVFGPIVFVLFITRFQILPEERAMKKLFGQAFVDYCGATRRWL